MACVVLQDGEALHGFQQASQQIAVRSAYHILFLSFSRLTHEPYMYAFPSRTVSLLIRPSFLRRAFKETNSPLMEHLPPLPGKGQVCR